MLSFCKVLVQSRILPRTPNGGEFYPVSGFQSPVSIPASTTPNQFLHIRFLQSFFIIPFSFKVVDARIDARPGSSKLVLSFCKVRVLVQSRIREFYPVSGFQSPVSIPASTTPNQFLQIQFSEIPFRLSIIAFFFSSFSRVRSP